MKIPDKVKIGSHIYTCGYSDNLTRDSDALGQSCGNALEIRVDAAIPRSNQESAFLHEVLEQINYRYELRLEHRTITVLETSLYQVMRDNPEAVKFIMGQD